MEVLPGPLPDGRRSGGDEDLGSKPLRSLEFLTPSTGNTIPAAPSSPEIFWPFSAVCLTVVPVRILTSDLHHRTERKKKPQRSEIMILECSFPQSTIFSSSVIYTLCTSTRSVLFIFLNGKARSGGPLKKHFNIQRKSAGATMHSGLIRLHACRTRLHHKGLQVQRHSAATGLATGKNWF